MARKSSKGPSPKRPRVIDYPAFLVRAPRELIDWVNDTAASAGLSRDAFMRQMLQGMKASFKAAQVTGTPEADLFRELEAKIESITERVTREVLESVLRSSQTPVRAGRAAGVALAERQGKP